MEDLESLHQKASAHYLCGDLASALETWRQLLELHPEDERAIEGVRLCEQLAGSEESTVCIDGHSPFAVSGDEAAGAMPAAVPVDEVGPAPESDAGTAPGGVAEAPEEDLDLSMLDLGEPGGESGSADPPPAEPGPEPPPGKGLLDLSSLKFGPGPEEAGPAESDGALDISDAAAEWGQQAAASAPPQESAAPDENATDEAAAISLRRRVNELLANALVAMERERKDEALRILDRLLILDEENEAARSLQEKIRLELDQQAPVPDEPELDLDYDAQVPEYSPEDEAIGVEPTVPDFDDEFPRDPDDGDGPPGDREEQEAAPVELAAETASAAGSSRPLSRWLLVVGAIAVLGGAGFWGHRYFYGSHAAAEPSVDPAAEAAAHVAAALESVPTEILGGGTQEAVAPAELEAAKRQQLDEILARAESAFETADFGAAVIAYNEALTLAPDDPELQHNLRTAGDRYREVQAIEAQWAEAAEEFENGNYKAALRFFYRLPEGTRQRPVERYKINAWYNLAVMALQSSDCRLALTHLAEVQEIREDEPGLSEAFRMAESCKRGCSTALQAQIAELRLRGLED